jgi:hypothetical protein
VELGVRYEHFVDAPHAVRGAYVRLHGSLLRLEETEMDAAKCGLPRVWEGQILDMEHRPVSFILTEDPRPTFEPDKVTIHTGGAVTLQGVFLMNCAYEDRTGGHTATPLIIARRLARRPAPAHGGTSSALRLLLTGLAGVGAASVAVMVWVLARRRPAPRTRASAGDADPGEMNETPMRQDPAVFDPADYLDANEPSDESQVG